MNKLLISILATMLFAAGAASAQPVKVTVGYTSVIDYLGIFVAKDQGLFEKNGLNVTLQGMPNGGAIAPGLLSGSLQVGAVTAPTVIQSKAAGFPIKILVGGTVVTKANPNGWIMVRKGVKVEKPSDLEGKRLGTGALGSYFNVLFQQWMKDHGADPAKVTVVEVPLGQITDVMRGGQIDAATIGQPFVGRMVADGIAAEYQPYTGDFADGLLSNIYVATDSWIAANPNGAAGFRKAIEAANVFIAEHPDQARESAGRYLRLPADTLTKLPFSNYRSVVAPAQIGAWSGIMRGQGLIDADIDPAGVLLR